MEAVKPLVSGAELRARLSSLMGKPVQSLRFSSFAIAPDERSIVFAFEGKPFGLGLEDGRLTGLAPEDRAALALSRSPFLPPAGGAIAEQREGGFTVRSAEGRTVVAREGVEPVSGKRRRVLREEQPETFVAGLDLAVGGWARQGGATGRETLTRGSATR